MSDIRPRFKLLNSNLKLKFRIPKLKNSNLETQTTTQKDCAGLILLCLKIEQNENKNSRENKGNRGNT